MGLPRNSLIRFPSGRWGFVGRVDPALAVERADGTPATDEEVAKARQFGMGLFRDLRRPTWATRGEALAAAEALGLPVDSAQAPALDAVENG